MTEFLSIETLEIGSMVAEYRQLKAQYSQAENEFKSEMEVTSDRMTELRTAIGDQVKDQGENFKDDQGYARYTTPKERVVFNSSSVDDLCSSWVESNDPILRSCGDMLSRHRTVKQNKPYVSIK